MSAVIPRLQMKGICKSFPGVQALCDVGFDAEAGQIHALAGENGAGKSTLMKILTGALRKDAGEILLQGQPASVDSPRRAQLLGISMVQQELTLIPYLTVGQNIFLGREPGWHLPGVVDQKRLYEQARAELDKLGISVDARALVADLSLAQRQMVEVAKALSQKAQVIALDEPTSSLTERETETLFGLMRALKAQGVTLIFISHRLEELFEVADVVTVLRDGQGVGTARVQDVTPADVVRMMVGRELGDMYPKASTPGSEVVLCAQGLRRGKDLRGVDLELRRGEVLGLAGLVGAGRTFVARALFGADPVESGEIWLEGRPVRMRSPEEAIRRGIGFVPEDRKSQALFLALAVRINLAIRQLQRVSHFGLLDFSALDRLAGSYVQRLGIRTPSLLQRVRNLSGGNQQKVVIARWLTIQPKVLILDEPTRGIDVGTKAEIHALIDELAKQGVAILMISSELPEILGISDRVLVMHEGQVVAEFARGQATQDAIMHAATGGGNRVS